MQRTMCNIRHFIWDFDGTLFNTYPVVIENLRKALRQYGHDSDPVEVMEQLLTSAREACNYYAKEHGIDAQELHAAYQNHRLRALSLLEAGPMEGVREVLEQICTTGRYNYIFTNRLESETRRYLEKHGYDKYFREIVGAEAPCFAYKPAPDVLLYLIDKYGMDAQDTVMIGDRDCDLGSARNANVGNVHYVCAMVPENLTCDWRFEDYGEMLALL